MQRERVLVVEHGRRRVVRGRRGLGGRREPGPSRRAARSGATATSRPSPSCAPPAYHATLSITSGGCGQDNADLVTYAQAVFDSDPEKNVIFDRHVYGGDADAAALRRPTSTRLAALGLPIIFGEFGPGRNIGPSPTNLTPASGHPDRREVTGWA